MTLLQQRFENQRGRKPQSFPIGKGIPGRLISMKIENVDDDEEKPRITIGCMTVNGHDSKNNEVKGGARRNITYDCFDVEGHSERTGKDYFIPGEDQVDRFMEDMYKMGFDTNDKEVTPDSIGEFINENRPGVLLNASKSRGGDYTNVYIGGTDAQGSAAIPEDQMPDDSTPTTEPSDNGASPSQSDQEEIAVDYSSFDYDSLGASADNESDESNAEAIDLLTEAAEAYGLNVDDFPESWTSMAEAIKVAIDSRTSEAGDDEGDFTPVKGETIQSKPKGTRSWTEYEVVSVVASKEECKVKRVSDGKVFANVPYSLCSSIEPEEQDE